MSGHLRTTAKVAAGFAALIVGVVLSVPGIPGPGLLTILLGLWLLSDHFEWACKMLEWSKERLDRFRQGPGARRRHGVPPTASRTSETNSL